MKARRIILVTALCLIGGAMARGEDKPPVTLAIFAFENNSIDSKERLDPLKKGIADMMTTRLSKVKSVKVVERQRMQALIEELHLNETDMVNPATALKLGKLLGARILVFGGYTSITHDEFRIDVRLVATETGETIVAEEETGSVDEVLPMVRTLEQKITIALEGISQ
jgi:curli biogenesis system outer membrane secretion channel CsgG